MLFFPIADLHDGWPEGEPQEGQVLQREVCAENIQIRVANEREVRWGGRELFEKKKASQSLETLEKFDQSFNLGPSSKLFFLVPSILWELSNLSKLLTCHNKKSNSYSNFRAKLFCFQSISQSRQQFASPADNDGSATESVAAILVITRFKSQVTGNFTISKRIAIGIAREANRGDCNDRYECNDYHD